MKIRTRISILALARVTGYTPVAPNITSFRAEPCTSPPPVWRQGSSVRSQTLIERTERRSGRPLLPAKPFWSQKLLIIAQGNATHPAQAAAQILCSMSPNSRRFRCPSTVADKLDTSTRTVGKWKRRFLEARLDGFETRRPGQPPRALTPKLRARILNAPVVSPTTAPRIGRVASSPNNSASVKRWSIKSGRRPASSPTVWNATGPPTIPTSSVKPPTSSGSTSTRRNTPPCFASMKKRPSKRSIVAIACCRYRRDQPSAMASSTNATARCHSTPP